MQEFRNAIACASLALGLAAFHGSGENKNEQIIQGIDARWSKSLQSKDLDAVMTNYAEDAVLLPPDEPIVEGKERIREWFAKRMALPGYSATFTPTKIVASRSGDIAYEVGTFRAAINDQSGIAITYLGKHLVTWEKRAGTWKVVAESINRDAPNLRP